MRILIHAANLTAGGGLAIGKEILRTWLRKKEATLFVLAAPAIAAFLEDEKAPAVNWICIPHSPGSSLSARRFFRKKAQEAERDFQPDVVFTLFGPPLWKPRAPHLCGFANGLYFPKNPVLPFRQKESLGRTLRHRIRRWLVFRSMQKDTDAVWVETDDAREKLLALAGGKTVFVVPNELSTDFKNAVFESKKSPEGKWKVLLLAAAYPHKNFSLLRVVSALPGMKGDFLFQTTLAPKDFEQYFQDATSVQNLGPLSGEQLLYAYQNADLIFCPSVAEIFSATWIEAMAAKRPLLCADLLEARQICGDAALYFNGQSPEAAADALRQTTASEDLRQSLVENGTLRLRALTPDKSRAEMLYQILCTLNRSQ